MIKQLLKIIPLLFLIWGCHRNNTVTVGLFSPNPLLTSDDVYGLNLERLSGIDIDVFELINNDTIIRIEVDISLMLLSQYWLFPIDSLTELKDIELFFEKEYNVVTLSRDTLMEMGEMSIVCNAYLKTNSTHFRYKIVNAEYYLEDEKGKYIIIYYNFPEYEKHLKKVII